jgi:hypothetical protein
MLTGWDAAALKNYQLADGTTFDAVVGDMNAALGAVNAEIVSDPVIASLVSYTDMPEWEYRTGGSNGFEDFTEYATPDPRRADIAGHMLPLKAYDRGLGWTWNYLRQARTAQVDADIADAIKDVRDLWRQKILTRLLKRSDDSGAAAGLGSTGYSPGFATAAASTNVDFTPPAYGGTSFTSDHEHYNTLTGGAMTTTALNAAKDDLREHGHEPPYDLIVGTTEETAIRALTGFVPVGSDLVTYGSTTSLANFAELADANGGYFIGVYNDIRIRVLRGMPQYYGFMYKSYGANSQRNPLRVRLQKGVARPRVTAFPDPRSGAGAAYPLQYMMLFTEFGVGVGDRTNGVPIYNNNSTWADGTAT